MKSLSASRVDCISSALDRQSRNSGTSTKDAKNTIPSTQLPLYFKFTVKASSNGRPDILRNVDPAEEVFPLPVPPMRLRSRVIVRVTHRCDKVLKSISDSFVDRDISPVKYSHSSDNILSKSFNCRWLI